MPRNRPDRAAELQSQTVPWFLRQRQAGERLVLVRTLTHYVHLPQCAAGQAVHPGAKAPDSAIDLLDESAANIQCS